MFKEHETCEVPGQCEIFGKCWRAHLIHQEAHYEEVMEIESALKSVVELAECESEHVKEALRNAREKLDEVSNGSEPKIYYAREKDGSVAKLTFTDHFLTEEERQIVVGIASEKLYEKIGEELELSKKQVSRRVEKIREKITQQGEIWPFDQKNILYGLVKLEALSIQVEGDNKPSR